MQLNPIYVENDKLSLVVFGARNYHWNFDVHFFRNSIWEL